MGEETAGQQPEETPAPDDQAPADMDSADSSTPPPPPPASNAPPPPGDDDGPSPDVIFHG